MKLFKNLIITVVVLAVLVGYAYYQSLNKNFTLTNPFTTSSSKEEDYMFTLLKNSTVEIPTEKVTYKLNDGKSSYTLQSVEVKVELTEFHDVHLNQIVTIQKIMPRNDTELYYLTILKKSGNKFILQDNTLLDEDISVMSLAIIPKQDATLNVKVEYLGRDPREEYTTIPTEPYTRIYKFEKAKLVEIKEETANGNN